MKLVCEPHGAHDQDGDYIIMDNVPIHHNRAGEPLGEWLDDIGCTLVYLPTYSPKFNPAVLVFNKRKTILKRLSKQDCHFIHT